MREKRWRQYFKANRMSNAIYVYQYMWSFPIELSLRYLPTGLYIFLFKLVVYITAR